MKRIMVVDDEKDLRHIVRLVLEKKGYEVEDASCGAECIKKIGEAASDLIIMDVRMPGMDGWKTIWKLKQKNMIKKTKIIMLTVEKGPGVEIFGLQDVVTDYLTKPFDSQQLLERVDKALNERD
ncbi:MAG: response regulator [Candidatus Altiarchaeales archaeon]|nr:response regulator [Candidatus Altiarchaeales archaeon]